MGSKCSTPVLLGNAYHQAENCREDYHYYAEDYAENNQYWFGNGDAYFL
jgi:hypothetical protein